MACDGNILLNGGFETWTTSPGAPDDWSVDGDGIIQKETVIVHGDTNSAYISEYYGIIQKPTFSDGCYTLDFWYNCNEENVAFFSLYRYDDDAIQEYLDENGIWQTLVGVPFVFLPATNGWENVVINFNADSLYNYEIGFGILSEGIVSYFDDICLVPCEEPGGEDALSASCGESLFKIDILRQRIRTDGTNYYLVVG